MRNYLFVLIAASIFPFRGYSTQGPATGELFVQKFDHIGELTFATYLYGGTHIEELDAFVLKFNSMPEYLNVSLSEVLTTYIMSKDECQMVNYIYKSGEHDLRLVSGRAAWILERVLKIELVAVSSDSTEEQLNISIKKALEEIEKRRSAAIAGGVENEDTTMLELQKEFSGTIKTGVIGEEYAASMATMWLLMEKWQPLGKSTEYVESIVGKKLKTRGDYFYYIIDSGFSGFRLKVQVRNGVIFSVTY
jgi:hypothetical protein